MALEEKEIGVVLSRRKGWGREVIGDSGAEITLKQPGPAVRGVRGGGDGLRQRPDPRREGRRQLEIEASHPVWIVGPCLAKIRGSRLGDVGGDRVLIAGDERERAGRAVELQRVRGRDEGVSFAAEGHRVPRAEHKPASGQVVGHRLRDGASGQVSGTIPEPFTG